MTDLGPDAPPLDVQVDSPFSLSDAGEVLCGSDPCACSNGEDDDADGMTDGLDPECTGPFDDDESTFATGIPGDNRDPNCQDCFFDGNSGSGDDGCRYATSCLTGGEPSGGGACATCEVSPACVDSCAVRTPNGCDCFGCCEVLSEGAALFIQIGESCSTSNLDDEEACPRCVQSTDCWNDCGRCELCLGRTPEDLPAYCMNEYQCEGSPSCDDSTACEDGFFCLSGCCVPVLI